MVRGRVRGRVRVRVRGRGRGRVRVSFGYFASAELSVDFQKLGKDYSCVPDDGTMPKFFMYTTRILFDAYWH